MASDAFNYVITGILNLDTTKATKEAQKFEKTFRSTVFTKNGKELHKVTTQVIEDLKDENGQIIKVAKSYDQFFHKVKDGMGNYTSQLGSATNATGQLVKEGTRFNETVLQTGRNLTELSMKLRTSADSTNLLKSAFGNLAETMVKVAKFKIATDIFGALIDSSNQAKEAIEEFDKALTDFKKVSDLDGSELNDYTKKLGELGNAVGRTRTMMVESATEFKKSGFSDADSAMLAQQAEMFRNISDEELTASESASILIGTMKGFGKSAEDVAHIEDVINEVSNTSAVSSSDIANGLANVSAVAHTANASLEETTGMLTAMVEITQSAGKSSRGLRQIFTRLFQTLDEGSSTGKKLKEIYSELGIEITDSLGNLRDPMEIFSELAQQWDTLSKNQQEYIALTSAGANQIQNFTALMSNFDKALEATETAYNSEGSAMKENSKYMESIEAQQTLMKKKIEDLVLGNGGLQSLEKILLKIANTVLTVLNNDLVQTTVKLGLLYALLSKVVPFLITNIVKITTSLKAQAIASVQATEGLTMMTAQQTLLNGAMTAFNGILSLIEAHPIAIALVALAGTIHLINNRVKAQREQFENTSQSLNQYKSDIESSTNKVDSLNKQLEELYKKRDKTVDPVELKKLDEKIIKKEDELRIEKAITQEKRDQAKLDAEKSLSKTVRTDKYVGTSEADDVGGQLVESTYGSTISAFKGMMADVEKIDKKLDNLKKKRADILSEKAKAEQTNDKEEKKRLQAEEKHINARITYELGLRDQLKNEIAKYAKTSQTALDLGVDKVDGEKIQPAIDKYNKLLERLDLAKKKFKDSSDVFNQLGVPAEELEDRWTGTAKTLEKFQELMSKGDYAEAYALAMKNCDTATGAFASTLQKTMGDALGEVKDVEDAYNALSSITADFNDNGVVSLDSLDKLFTKYPEYIKYLEFEGNQLKINKDGIDKIANARLNEAEAEVYNAYSKEVRAIKEADMKGKVYDSQKATDAQTNSSKKNKATIETLIKTLGKGEKAWIKYNSAVLNGKYEVQNKKNKKAMKEAQSNLYTSLKILDSARGKMGSFTKSIDANTSSTKSNTKAQKDNQEALKALEEEVKNYEKVIKYIESKFDKQIDKIKELKDAEINSIKDRIEALKELRDKEIEPIEAKIKALEEQNKALEEQKQLEELLNNVAKASASKVKIYRNGRFVYERNQEEYNSARKALNEYLSKKKLQDEIDALNKHKEELKNNYDKQIKDLENFQKEREKYYDAQIKYWQDYKKQFDDMTKAYEDEQNRLLALQLTGIDFENDNWTKRMGNLTSFVNAYIQKLRELQNAQAQYNASQSISSASGSGYSGSGGGGGGRTTTKHKKEDAKRISYGKGIRMETQNSRGMWGVTKSKGGSISVEHYDTLRGYVEGVNTNGTRVRFRLSDLNKNSSVKYHYAKGSDYIDSNQMAIVGEAPNSELVIGSSLNSGVQMGLQKGSGVLNATATSALMNLADKIRANGVNAVANDISNGGENITMDIGHITVNANNADEFVDSMKDFKNSVLQRVYI